MYWKIHRSKRKVKVHNSYNKYIPANTDYIRVSNGTIGQGARHINIPITEILKKLSEGELILNEVFTDDKYDNVVDDIPF